MAAALCCLHGEACTNLIVGKKASADGSVIVSYSADDFGSFGYLRHFAAGRHAAGQSVYVNAFFRRRPCRRKKENSNRCRYYHFVKIFHLPEFPPVVISCLVS